MMEDGRWDGVEEKEKWSRLSEDIFFHWYGNVF